MIDLRKTVIITLVLSTWILFFGASINPLAMGTHAVNTISPMNLFDMTDEQASMLDEKFVEFNNSLTHPLHEYPANWQHIPQRIELLALDLFFRDLYGYGSNDVMTISLSPYYTASQLFGENDSYGQLLTIANYLIHRGQNAWIYTSSTGAWIEVYIGRDWLSDMEFGESAGLYGEWLIKFNDQAEIFSLTPFIFNLIIRYLIAFILVLSIHQIFYFLTRWYKDLQIQKESNKSLKEILSYYMAVGKHFVKCIISLPFNFVRDVIRGMKEEIQLLINRSDDKKISEIHDEDSIILTKETDLSKRRESFIRKLLSVENIILLALSGLITLLIPWEDQQQVLMRFIIAFIFFKFLIIILKFVSEHLPFDYSGVVDFVTLDLFTYHFDIKKTSSTIYGMLKSSVLQISGFTGDLLSFLLNNKSRILLSVASWISIFFLYWVSLDVMLSLLGYQYTAGGHFGREVMGNLTILNLISLGLFVGALAGVTVIIWRNYSERARAINHI